MQEYGATRDQTFKYTGPYIQVYGTSSSIRASDETWTRLLSLGPVFLNFSDKLREVVARGFGEDEVTRAKDLLFESASGMTQFNHIRKKVRKNTGGRKKVEMDVEDILHLCYEADKAKANLPRFAVIDINSFPCIPLEEVDCGAVAEKVVTCLSSELQEAVEKLTKEVECIELKLKDMNKSVSDRPGEVAETYQSYADSVKSGKNPTQVHVEVEEKSTRDLVEKKERSMNVLNNTRLTTY